MSWDKKVRKYPKELWQTGHTLRQVEKKSLKPDQVGSRKTVNMSHVESVDSILDLRGRKINRTPPLVKVEADVCEPNRRGKLRLKSLKDGGETMEERTSKDIVKVVRKKTTWNSGGNGLNNFTDMMQEKERLPPGAPTSPSAPITGMMQEKERLPPVAHAFSRSWLSITPVCSTPDDNSNPISSVCNVASPYVSTSACSTTIKNSDKTHSAGEFVGPTNAISSSCQSGGSTGIEVPVPSCSDSVANFPVFPQPTTNVANNDEETGMKSTTCECIGHSTCGGTDQLANFSDHNVTIKIGSLKGSFEITDGGTPQLANSSKDKATVKIGSMKGNFEITDFNVTGNSEAVARLLAGLPFSIKQI